VGAAPRTLQTIAGGTQTINAGTANNTTINSGEQDVGPNGIAENTTIAGGLMHVMAGAGTGGTSITFSSLGTLVIDQPVSGSTSLPAQLVGLQLYDKIDLAGLPFVSGANFTLSTDHSQLTVTSESNSETFSLMNDSAIAFSVKPDGNGGTDLAAIPVGYHYVVAEAFSVNTIANGTPAVVDVTVKFRNDGYSCQRSA
jgi:autotransporter passenger strand-loop-strand repeat protein